MQLFSRFLSLRRRGHSTNKNKSRQSSGSSFEYGQPSVDRLSGDFDPYQYRSQAADYSDFDLTRSAGIPIRVTTPRSFPLPQHPIDHVPRRDQNELASPRLVKIHRKKLLQRTEFPCADPPRSPRKVSQAGHSRSQRRHQGRIKSVHCIESAYSDSGEDLTFEYSHLDNLRRDPSVLSLVSIMDSQGFISSTAFTNGSKTPKAISKHSIPSHYARFVRSTPELSVRIEHDIQFRGPIQTSSSPKVNTVPETPSARSRSECLLPSLPQNNLPLPTRCVTPESHSFSSLQVEPGSFSLTGDSTKNPALNTHKSLPRASEAFRFLEDRRKIHLPPTSTVPSRRGYSANDAVAESSLMSRQFPNSRASRIPFVHEPEGQTLSSTNATYNLSPNLEPICFPLTGAPIANSSPMSHISHSRIISPLDNKLVFGSPTGRDTDFADTKKIRTFHPLHTTSGTLDMRKYNCHVPTHSVYMQSPARNDQHTRVIHTTPRTPIEEGRAGTGISFGFSLGNNIVNSDSVGDRLNSDQQEITPGRPTVVLVPSGRQLDRGETPASASAPASVKPELEHEQNEPLFALGLDPHFQQEPASQSAISCTDSFQTAREEFAIGDHASWTSEFGVQTRFARHGNYQLRQTTRNGPPRLHLDLSQSPLVTTCSPGTPVSSSWSQDRTHHGTQYIVWIDRSARVSPNQTPLSFL
ncbi:hypothetical protein RhiXN_05303 [Rhizoctonia solani]|uniref:Uncharacterized protein n=1 Tax=Rhizoctonia solani TaxID=456999 RepID=A0A8H8NRV3_9AGAM|nr:uncharacterized protein RhiXN_05303 [Rhizoctonia solani]QRW17301.1 hypothetical protein RhiXN_05303 [Rhizoctonia solani]